MRFDADAGLLHRGDDAWRLVDATPDFASAFETTCRRQGRPNLGRLVQASLVRLLRNGSVVIIVQASIMDGDLVSHLARLSVSLPAELLAQLDAMVGARGLPSRSQMIAELIRRELAEQGEGTAGQLLAGTITLIYRAESGRVRHALAQTQLAYLKEVISSQHVFLEDDRSLEVLLVQGPSERLGALCDDLRRIRGVQQIQLVSTTALLPPLHGAADPTPPVARSGR